jgi:hypothetical protein
LLPKLVEYKQTLWQILGWWGPWHADSHLLNVEKASFEITDPLLIILSTFRSEIKNKITNKNCPDSALLKCCQNM